MKRNTSRTPLPSVEAMTEEMAREKAPSKLYPEVNSQVKAAHTTATIDAIREGLARAASRERVDLSDTERVMQRTRDFLEACSASATPPTLTGLCARGYGMSRRRVNAWMAQHADHETAIFLETVKDNLADLLQLLALGKTTDAVTTIFLLKNLHEYSDRVEIEPIVRDSYPGANTDAQTLARAYLDQIPDEDV